MAGKQSSEVKRRTASTRKTTTTRKSSAGKKRNTSGKSANTKASRMQVSEYTEPVGDEIKLIIILAVSILILLSVFGLGGRVGDKAAYLFFGLFGFVAYALPFLPPLSGSYRTPEGFLRDLLHVYSCFSKSPG